MELKQLEYFRAIVDAGTISGAARDLHMTQPPLSYQIKMLEEELQVPLFLRGKKRITLTEAGKTLYEQAGNLLMLSDLAKREVIKSSQSATLHIGMTPSTVSMMSDHLLSCLFPLEIEKSGAPPPPKRFANAVMITINGKQIPTAPSAFVPTSGIRAIYTRSTMLYNKFKI